MWEHFEQDPAAQAETRALLAYARDSGFRVIVDITFRILLSPHFRDDRNPERAATGHGDGLPLSVLRTAYGADEVPREWSDEPIRGLPFWEQWAVNYDCNRTLGRAMKGLARASKDFERFAAVLGATFGSLLTTSSLTRCSMSRTRSTSPQRCTAPSRPRCAKGSAGSSSGGGRRRSA